MGELEKRGCKVKTVVSATLEKAKKWMDANQFLYQVTVAVFP